MPLDEMVGPAKDWKPMVAVEVTIDDKFKTHYSQDENYRAYQLFSIMDTDGGGSIDLRELKRLLIGGGEAQTFEVTFEHPDSGIVWILDQDNCVCIDHVEVHSPATKELACIKGLRLCRVNDVDIHHAGGDESLQALFAELIHTHDGI
jgi:hypothetical protein